ncbi:hypothetical protein E05_33640 [Plautia stali symbiont]|nr:hypothetical protein E05_33640 [Plautia stali symbiont]
MTGKTLIDDLQRLQTLAHHATLGIGIIGADIAIGPFGTVLYFRTVTVAIEQRVNLSLGENAIAH